MKWVNDILWAPSFNLFPHFSLHLQASRHSSSAFVLSGLDDRLSIPPGQVEKSSVYTRLEGCLMWPVRPLLAWGIGLYLEWHTCLVLFSDIWYGAKGSRVGRCTDLERKNWPLLLAWHPSGQCTDNPLTCLAAHRCPKLITRLQCLSAQLLPPGIIGML